MKSSHRWELFLWLNFRIFDVFENNYKIRYLFCNKSLTRVVNSSIFDSSIKRTRRRNQPKSDLKMKKFRKLINKSDTYYPAVVDFKKGKYGEYCQINGINYSLKKALEIGYVEMNLTEEELATIISENKALRAEEEKACHDRWMASLTKATIKDIEGNTINSLSDLKSASINIGQETQGSDAWEKFVFIDGAKYIGRRHWSASGNGFGIWKTEGDSVRDCKFGEFIGDVNFENGESYIRYSK